MTIPGEDMRNDSTEINQSKNTDEIEMVTETDTEIIQREGKIPMQGQEVEGMKERGMPKISVSSKWRGNFIMREDVSIARRMKQAVVMRLWTLVNLMVKIKTKIHQIRRNQVLNCLVHS